MSSGKSANAAQNSVVERRLRPVYDWLDNGFNKKALQEAERVLKKQPDLQCAKVLMSLALLRMGRESEANPILEKVLEEAPTEDSVLQAMTIAYKELNQVEKICKIYENAIKKEPQNEELLSHLFMSYVRQGEYKKQQMAALQLYKVKQKNPYYFWAVMSIVLQASEADEKTAVNIMLPLAERMVTKLEREAKLQQEQEIVLYLYILDKQDKFQKILDVLESNLGANLQEQTSFINMIPNMKLKSFMKLNMWANVNSLIKTLIQRCPDQWDWYQYYCQSVCAIVQKGGENFPDDVDASFDEANKFLHFLQKNNSRCRGPFLAELELFSLQLAHSGNKDTEGASALLLKYFQHFASKSCCAFDMKVYLKLIEDDDSNKFLNSALQFISLDANGIPTSLVDINRHVSWHQLKSLLVSNKSTTREEQHTLLEVYEKLYNQSQCFVKDYNNTEQRPNDSYIILQAHLLYKLWTETGQEDYFWKAVTTVESVLKMSPANYHLRFILIKFYNRAGAVGASKSAYEGLEVKHVQLDSLGYLLCRHLITNGHFNLASTVIGNTLRFFTGNYKDIVDHIISAYRCGSFTKIQDFISLRDRLSNSIHYAALTVERMLMDLIIEPSQHPQTVKMISYLDLNPKIDEIKWEKLRDNRDFKAIVYFENDKSNCLTSEAIKESFECEKLLLKYRSVMMRGIAAAIYLSEEEIYSNIVSRSSKSSSNSLSNGECNPQDTLIATIKDLIDQLADVESEYNARLDFSRGFFENPAIQSLDRPRLQLFLRDGTAKLIQNLLKLVISCQTLSSSGKDSKVTDTDANTMLQEVTSHLQLLLDKQERRLREDSGRLMRDRHIETFFNIAESLSFTAIVIGICHTQLKPKSANKKSKKKKQCHPDLANFIETYNKEMQTMKTIIARALEMVASFSKVVDMDSLTLIQHKFSQIKFSEDAKMSNSETENPSPAKATFDISLDAIQDEISKKLHQSYEMSLGQITTVLKKKEEYFHALRL